MLKNLILKIPSPLYDLIKQLCTNKIHGLITTKLSEFVEFAMKHPVKHSSVYQSFNKKKNEPKNNPKKIKKYPANTQKPKTAHRPGPPSHQKNKPNNATNYIHTYLLLNQYIPYYTTTATYI